MYRSRQTNLEGNLGRLSYREGEEQVQKTLSILSSQLDFWQQHMGLWKTEKCKHLRSSFRWRRGKHNPKVSTPHGTAAAEDAGALGPISRSRALAVGPTVCSAGTAPILPLPASCCYQACAARQRTKKAIDFHIWASIQHIRKEAIWENTPLPKSMNCISGL